MKILIVDDDAAKAKEVNDLLSSALSATNLALQIASSGLEARERLSTTKFDLLVLDIKLPLRPGDEPDRRGGFSLLTEITLSDRFIRPGHVVALTGYDELRQEFDSKFNNGQWSVDTYDPADAGWRERLKAKATYLEKVALQSGKTYETDLCIVVALASPELDAVRSLPWNWSEAEALDSVSFLYRGSFASGDKSRSVVATACPRMGMVAAATLTQKVIQQVRPRILAMTGICAGVRGTCELGDVLLADPAWDWQMGKYLQEAFEIAPDQIPAPLEISQRLALMRNERALMIDVAEKFTGEKPNSIPSVRIGPVASGSAVLANQAITDTILKQHRKLVGIDMELYGLYSAARDASPIRPITFGIKSVCDFADHLKNDKLQKYASYMSAQVLRAFIEKYAAELLDA